MKFERISLFHKHRIHFFQPSHSLEQYIMSLSNIKSTINDDAYLDVQNVEYLVDDREDGNDYGVFFKVMNVKKKEVRDELHSLLLADIDKSVEIKDADVNFNADDFSFDVVLYINPSIAYQLLGKKFS